ncbi:hypothetical protein SBOR_7509 [Sclerotinia borealis F-4128]|uniref:2EXR domain-containing protein n=1 Tax=Sclerotinia borealis (strain F-4128) TaxID=1432307 RepID=W9CB61_SCLBF|nr:hypothetical protein SBOR_7509 [Sclerotinia borealis F-4128]
MHPHTFGILRMEESLRRMQIFESFDPLTIGVDHNRNSWFKARHAFCLFPKLPPELQLMIWAAAADDRQIVRIKPCAEDGSGGEGFLADYTAPKYTVIFEGILRNPIYFNYQQDFVSLVGSSTLEHFTVLSGEDNTISEEIQRIENVLLMVTGLGSGESEEDVLIDALAIWDGVKRLIIAERSPTWWGTFKEIWSDREVKKISDDAKAKHTRERLHTPGFPEVRIVKFGDVLNTVESNENQSSGSTYAMLRFFDFLFDADSTYNTKRAVRRNGTPKIPKSFSETFPNNSFISVKYIVPSPLHVCQSSRELALKIYRRVPTTYGNTSEGSAPFYINADEDSILFETEYRSGSTRPALRFWVLDGKTFSTLNGESLCNSVATRWISNCPSGPPPQTPRGNSHIQWMSRDQMEIVVNRWPNFYLGLVSNTRVVECGGDLTDILKGQGIYRDEWKMPLVSCITSEEFNNL